MKRVIKAVQSHRRTAGFVLAGLILIVGGFFVLPEFISADGALIWTVTKDFTTDAAKNLHEYISDVAVDSSGVYVVGHAANAVDQDTWRVEKRNLTDGSVIWEASVAAYSWAEAVALDSSSVYIGGTQMIPGTNDWQARVEKRNLTDGSLLWSANRNFSTRGEWMLGIAVDSTGVYAVGRDDYYSTFGSNNTQWYIEKRNLTDGSLLWSAFSNPTNAYDVPFNVAVDSSGLYVVGCEYKSGEGILRGAACGQWRIEKRSLSDGSLITSFGTNGVVTSNPGTSGNDMALDIAIDSANMYVAGTTGSRWYIEKRNLTDGSLVTSFGSSGALTINFSSIAEYAWTIAIDSNYLYVGGDDYSPGSIQWRIEKRSLTDGSLLWTVASNPSGVTDRIYGIAVDSSGVYAGGFDSSPGTYQWRMEKRRTSAPPTPPTVTTQSASSVGDSSAVLKGLANPNNGATTGWFRYDTISPVSCNDTFGTRLPLSGGTSLGSGSSNVSFAQTAGGLNSTTTYYFCAIAENSAGKSYGSVLSFITAAPGVVSSYGVTREGCQLKNWGWGDEVVGWVSFNSANNYSGKTPGANYGATLTNFCQNVAPNAPSGLSATDTSSANWSFNCVSPLQPTFSWTFSDPNTDDSQYAYQIQVDNNSDFSSPEYDSGSVTSTALTTSIPAGRLSYNTTYNWRVKTWDNRKTPLVSPWTNGTPFTTTVHRWPSPDFTFLPNAPSVGQDVLIRRDQDSDGDTFGTRCFDINNNSVSCSNYYWTIQDSSPVMSNTASSSIPVIISFTSAGRKEIMLKAVDADGFYCLKLRTTGTVTLPLPIFKEVLPR